MTHADPRSSRVLRAFQVVAVTTLLAHAAHTGLGLGHPALDTLFDEWIYNALMLSAAGACVVRALVVPRDRGAWLILAAGVLIWSLGDIYYTLFLADDATPPYPSLSDAAFLAFYPACYVALALLVRRNLRGFHRSLWLDGLIGALAVSAVGAAVLYDAVSATLGGDTVTILTNLAYPVGDVLLLAFVVGLLALTGWRPGRTWTLIGAGLALSALGDAVYLYQASLGTYREGTILDTVWPASILLLGLAAWQRPRFGAARLEGLRVLTMPSVFAFTALGLLIADQVHPLNELALVLALATLLVLCLRMATTVAENMRMLAASRGEALTDALTGLGNRRRLVADLREQLADADVNDPRVLILFDLDGFKHYNDSFGHLAGDALLSRLGRKLAFALYPHGGAYRLGGDEFCALVSVDEERLEEVIAATVGALTEEGEGFRVSTSYGAVLLPHEAQDVAVALQTADQRMYARKDGRSSPVRRQTRDVLLRALQARQPDLHEHVNGVADLAVAVARRLGMDGEALDEVARAAELHDVGKVAVPDEILNKPSALDEDEWAFMRRHTILGERILNAAPSLRPVAELVRASHERFDGRGYPDGLAGEDIPLGARIVSVCDAYDAMTTDRPYRRSIGEERAHRELRRAAGTQFDPDVVEAFAAEQRARKEDRHRTAEADERLASVREVANHLRDVLALAGERTG